MALAYLAANGAIGREMPYAIAATRVPDFSSAERPITDFRVPRRL
jgi:hypothetical protein